MYRNTHTQTQALEESPAQLSKIGAGAVALARKLLGGQFAAAVLEVGGWVVTLLHSFSGLDRSDPTLRALNSIPSTPIHQSDAAAALFPPSADPAADIANDIDVEVRVRAQMATYLTKGGSDEGGMRERATELLFLGAALLNLYLQVRNTYNKQRIVYTQCCLSI